jgi:hypothetical protein
MYGPASRQSSRGLLAEQECSKAFSSEIPLRRGPLQGAGTGGRAGGGASVFGMGTGLSQAQESRCQMILQDCDGSGDGTEAVEGGELFVFAVAGPGGAEAPLENRGWG